VIVKFHENNKTLNDIKLENSLIEETSDELFQTILFADLGSVID
jgi:hypothetical protein